MNTFTISPLNLVGLKGMLYIYFLKNHQSYSIYQNEKLEKMVINLCRTNFKPGFIQSWWNEPSLQCFELKNLVISSCTFWNLMPPLHSISLLNWGQQYRALKEVHKEAIYTILKVWRCKNDYFQHRWICKSFLWNNHITFCSSFFNCHHIFDFLMDLELLIFFFVSHEKNKSFALTRLYILKK